MSREVWNEDFLPFILIVGLILYMFGVIIYRVWFHPLAKHPGPFLAKVTGYYSIYYSICGKSSKHRYNALCKYGECVRIGPNELLFGDVASVKDIYGQSSTLPRKDQEFYKGFSFTGTPNVLSSSDKEQHARIRRLLSHSFAFSNVIQLENRFIHHIKTYLKKLEDSPQPMDVYEMTHHLFLDTISEISFDKSFNCLTSGPHASDAMDGERALMISSLKGMVPFIEWIPLPFIRKASQAGPRLEIFATQCVKELQSRIGRGESEDSSLLKRMIAAKDDGNQFHDKELMENAIIFIQAGAGTSLVTLIYLIWRLDKAPSVRERFIKEIRDAFPDKSVYPDFRTVNQLPYLSKVFNEVMRLHAPLAVSLPRISPGKIIGGHVVPRGTRINNLSYYTHRHPMVFPDPLEFKPDRWDHVTPDMQTMFRPFSIGPHNCIGMHVARVQLLLAIAGLYQRYDIIVDTTVTEETMLEEDRGILFPHQKKFFVHVEKVMRTRAFAWFNITKKSDQNAFRFAKGEESDYCGSETNGRRRHEWDTWLF